MKGKKLIVIMAIVILIFTIQASCALENDNDFNLTQTINVNTVDNQIVDDNQVNNELNDSAGIKNNISVSSKSNVLGVSNEDDVLGTNWTPSTNTMNALRNLLINTNLKPGDNVFLNGWTYSGDFNYFTVRPGINIYGGSSTSDSAKATLDFSGIINHPTKSRIIFGANTKITGVNFANHYFESSVTTGSPPGRGHLIACNGAVSFYNCTFENNTVYQKSYIINYEGSGSGAIIENCEFYYNTASVIVCTQSTITNFKANNNLFKHNKGTISLDPNANSNSLGLCFKVNSVGAVFDNNTFINNTNAVHGAAYCVNAENVIISNNHIENNSASYGAGIECHKGTMKVYNTTFIGNQAYGPNVMNPARSGGGGAIAFIGPNNYIENCTFINNSAEKFGGAMDIHTVGTERADNTVVVDSRFENNFAESDYGGAIFIQGDFANITNCTLTNNYAPIGGAIQIVGSNAGIYDSKLVENGAVQGGAVYIDGNAATVGNSTFANNTATHNLGSRIVDNPSKVTSGGAMFIQSNDVSIKDTSFESNVAEGNYSLNTGLGGGLYLIGQNPDFDNVNFTQNDATLGGGVYIEGSNIDASNINLYNNTAVQGGAVYIDGNDITLDKITAKENNAIQGGAVYIQGHNTEVVNSTFDNNLVTRDIDSIKPGAETLLTMGGAIYIDGNNVVVAGNNTFRRNIASGFYINGGLGGAIAVEGDNTTIYDGQFTLNEAVSGGAIYIDGANATVKDMHFTTNNAVQGGSIFINGANTNITGNTFYDNNATHNLSFNASSVISLPTIGGAISVSGDYSTITNNNFTYNAAIGVNTNGGLGGAIAVDGYHTNITDNIFDDNEAIMGGALYVTGTNTTIYNTNFTYNRAIKGGAAYIKGINTTVENSQFMYNNATHNLTYNLNPIFDSVPAEGGAIDIVGNNTLLDNLLFSENNAIGVNPDGGLGGAVAVNGYDTRIVDVTFDANQAIKGGAIYVNGTLNALNYTNFTSNSAIRGGAVFITAFNTTFLGCDFDNNTATHDLRFAVNDELNKLTSIGGGIAIQGNDVNIINSTFTNNTAVGIYEDGGLGGAVAVNGTDNWIYNSLFEDNEAIKGGAFYLEGGSTVIEESNFTDNHAIKGGAGYIDGENSVIKNSLFEDNNATHDLKFNLSDALKNSATAGGAVYIIGHDVNVTSSNFTHNHANAENQTSSIGGGAFYIEGNKVNITDSKFEENTALKGGAVYVTGNVTMIYDSNFTRNSVTNFTVMEGFGGAVYLESSHNSDFTRCNFENNSASINGGAIDWHEGATDGQILDCTFTNNTAGANGGAVFWFGTGGIIKGSNFTNNAANGTVACMMGNSGDGGAIMWTGSNGVIDDCEFIDNTCTDNGGAIYLRGVPGRADCNNNSFINSHFENNSAGVNGGAITWENGATNGKIENTTFENNTAGANGGAVFWYGTNGTIEGSNFTNNRALGTETGTYGDSGQGGAVIWTGSNGLVDDCIFVNNTAAANGGAVYLRNLTANGCDNTTFSNSHFENNTAGVNGGAIDWHEGATNGAILNSTFENNSAKANGGAVFWYGTNGTIAGSNFTNNRALGTETGTYGRSGQGGAVIWTGSNGIVDECNFINNSAKNNGGAVYLDSIAASGCDNTTFSNSHFENNTAGTNGGAIDWHKGATNGKIINSSFENNSALANGGAVFWYGTNGTIAGSNFTNNRALGQAPGTYGDSGQGGAVIWTGSNGLVDDSIFENNSAANNGGAVYLRKLNGDECNNTTFANSKFYNNTAVNEGGAIDWNEGATYGAIKSSVFENNSANDGGAVSWTGHNGQIVDSNFTNNNATRNGGAVRWSGIDGKIDGSRFEDNNATYGGAIFLQNCAHSTDTNVTISDSYFENNTASEDGGAINWHKGTNATIDGSTFVDNTAKRGGAVFVNGTEGDIKASDFTSNEAIMGGAVYLNNVDNNIAGSDFTENAAIQGGAVYVDADNNIITGSNFDNNTATYDLRMGAASNLKTKGGAIYINGENTIVENSKFYNNTAKTNRAYNNLGNDPSGPDDGFGGAIFVAADNVDVTSSEFNDNKAVNGSAVYNDASNTRLDNDTFYKNQAWSYILNATAVPNSTYYGTKITMSVANYTGGDNIINGVYNAKGENDIVFNEVNYIVNNDESQIRKTKSSVNPVMGAENSNDGVELYQDSRERYQVITFEIISNETGNVVMTKTVNADLYGNYSFDVTGLKPGNYTLKAYHTEDRNYKAIETQTSFEIFDYVDLNITKEVSSYYTIIGNNVTFTITVSNAYNGTNATNLIIKDVLPAGLVYLDVDSSEGKFNRTTNVWTIDKLANGTSATLTLVFNTTQIGKFNNTVNVTCDQNEWNYTNNNATVYYEVILFNLTINKTANVSGNISVHDEATFTVNITNNAKVNATHVIVKDVVPKGFEFVRTNVTGYNSTTGELIIPVIEAGKSYLFNITLKAMTNGTLTNVVNVTCIENTTVVSANASVNVTPVVNLTVKKIVDYDDALVGDVVTFTIIITNNGPSNATNIIVHDVLPNDLVLVQGNLDQTIAFLASGNSTNVTIKVTTGQVAVDVAKPYTNWVYVNCSQNTTVKSANATVRYFNTDIKINKTVDKPVVYINDYVNFTVSIKNHGTGPATNINITDVLPSGFKLIQTNGTNITESLYKVGILQNEEIYSFWIYAQVLYNGTFTNTAYVNCTEEGTLQDASATVKVLPIVKLSVDKTVNVTGEISAGKLVNFTIKVTNNGISNATGVNISDIIKDGFVFVGSNATGYDNKTGLLTIPLIKPKESYIFNITMKVVKEGRLTNIVNVTCNENSTFVYGDASVDVKPIILTVNKTVNITEVGNNTLVNFTIVVNNTSVFEATGVIVKDILPNGFVAVNATKGNVTRGQLVTWNVGTLASGQNATYWIVARSNATGNWTNVVNVTCNENETVVSDNASVEVVPVTFDVNKTANITRVGNNTLVNFTIVVKNTQRVNATAVVISDVLPNGFVFENATKGYKVNAGSQIVSWDPITVLSGKNVTYWIVARSNATGNWTNVVNVTSKENSTVVKDNVAIEVVSVVLAINKTANATVVGNNTLVEFTIVVNNTSIVNATGVVVKDGLPNGFEFVNATDGYDKTYNSWTVDIPAGKSATFTIVGRSCEIGNWTNHAYAISNENDTLIHDEFEVKVVPVVLTVNKTANITKVGNNTLVNFTIVVKNTGSMNATGVNVGDKLPEGFVFVNATDNYIQKGQNISWKPFNLTDGANATFWIVARSNATGIWNNTVTATSSENVTDVKTNATVEVAPITFTVNKTANITLIGNNTLVNFTIVVNMTSSINATNVTVCDKLPNGFVLVDAAQGYKEDGQLISWNYPNFTDKSIELWIVARSNATGVWDNVVNVTSNENKTLVRDNVTVKVVQVNATIIKTANDTVVGNNTLVNFTITVNHTSLVNATEVSVVDVLPDGFVFVNATEGYSNQGQRVSWNVGTLTPGQNLNYWIVARSVAIKTWDNTVTIECKENSTVLGANATVEVVPVNATIIKQADKTLVGNNTLVNFTIIVNNTSRANASNVIISDKLPDGFVFVNATEGYVQNGQEVMWIISSLRTGEIETYWIVAKSIGIGMQNNIVNVSCDQNTTLKANATVEIVPMNATISKTANITEIANNTLVNFTIVVDNIARVNATNVTITDTLPEGLVYVSSGSDKLGEGRYAKINGVEVVIWNLDTLKTSEIIELWIVARSADAGNWTNAVNVKSSENDTMGSANDTVEVIPVNITVTKMTDSVSYELFDNITYTINVTNNARLNAKDVVITDIIDLSKFEIKKCSLDYVLDGNKLTWNLSTLKAGESFVIDITVKALKEGNFTNVVNVTSYENQTVVSGNVTVTVIPVVHLKVTKKVNVEKIGLNNYVIFTINITNDGPSNATDVCIVDVLPYGLELLDSSLGDFIMSDTAIIPLIKVGESVEFNITALALEAGNFTNIVNVTCSENGTVISDNASVEVKVVNVTVVKYPDVKIVGNSSLVNYTIVVSNIDDLDAYNVDVEDSLPDCFDLVNATEGWSVYLNDIGWHFDKIAKGTNVTLWVLVKPNRLGNLTNVVSVIYDENNNPVFTNSTVEVVPVNLTINKTSNVNNINIGEQVTFTVNITNNAIVNATEVNVTDIVPTGFEFVEASVSGYDNKTGLLTIPVIKAGESYVFTIALKAILDGVLTNVVNVTCRENETAVNATASVNVTPIVNLTVEKVADSDDATIGDVITFTITVTNNGLSNATNIKVADILDTKGFELIDGNLSTVIPFLANGNSTTIVVKVMTKANGTYINIVEVSCDQNDTVKSANATVHVYNTDLKINKTTADTNVSVGDNVNFTIVIKNHGKSNATNIRITDVLDNAFEFVNASGNYTRNGQNIVWTVDRLANETSYSVWIVVKALTNGTFDNIAHVNCSEEVTVKNSTSTVNVNPVVNLTVVKTVDTPVIDICGEVTFTINVTNNGLSNATGVKVTDVVPVGFEFVKSSDSAYDNKTGILTVPVIKPGESYVFNITLKAITDGTITNVVNVTCSENDTLVNDSIDVKVNPIVNLTVEKVDDSDDATIGDIITFTITVTNNGPSNATNIKVTDILDEDGFKLIEGDLQSIISFLASGESTSIVVKVVTTANGTFMNRVNVSCDQNDTVKSANATVHVYITDMKINKTTVDTNVSVGDNVNFTIVIKNHGKSNAANIHISDVLDDGFEFVDASGNYTRNGQSIVWIVDNLTSEDSYSVWIVVKALANGTFDNVAHVNCSEEETVKNSTSTVNVNPVVNLTVEKIANVSNVSIGSEITYTINVTNNGPSDATNVVVEDALPEGLELVEGDLKTTIDLLPSGKSYVITVKVKATSAGNRTNVVSVHCDENATEVKSNATVLVTNPLLSATQTANDEFVYLGNQTSFTIKVTNDGDVVLHGIHLEDILDDGLIYDSFIGSNWTYDGSHFHYDGSLDVGESIELILVVNTTRSGIFNNIISAGSDEVPSSSATTKTANVTVYTPGLTVREIANNPVAVVGEHITFTVVVTNVGDCELEDIYTVNNFPDGLIYTGYEGGSWTKLTSGLLGVEASGWTQDGNKFAYSGTLKPGESANYTLHFDTTTAGVFTPEVIANSHLTSGAYSNNTTVVIAPSIAVTKEASANSIKVGDIVEFTITVINNGSCDAKDIFVIEDAPSALVLVAYYDTNWTLDGNKFTYSGTLAAGESAELIVRYKAISEGHVVNVVIAGANDANNTTDTCEVEIVSPNPSMIVIKTPDVTTVKEGELVAFTITVINNGDCELGDIFVIEKPSKNLKFVDFDGDDWIKSGNKFLFLGSLAPGESASFTVVFKAVKAGIATNVVIAGSNMTADVTASANVTIEENKTPIDANGTSDHSVGRYATGNPVILLLLAIIAVIPIKRRKH